jgi:hypothetical protein
MHDDRVFRPEDFKNDAVRAFAELVKTAEGTFERKQLRGIEVQGESFKSIDDALGNGSIELFKLFGCDFEESNAVQLQAELLANGTEIGSPITLCDSPFLAEKSFA